MASYDRALGIDPNLPGAQNRTDTLGALRGTSSAFADMAYGRGLAYLSQGRFTRSDRGFRREPC
jgi:hypothetical protein